MFYDLHNYQSNYFLIEQKDSYLYKKHDSYVSFHTWAVGVAAYKVSFTFHPPAGELLVLPVWHPYLLDLNHLQE